jgi:hypothetical protein
MLSQHHHFFKKFSISDAAIAYKKPRSTILRHIRNGDFELDYNNLIDYSQLVKNLENFLLQYTMKEINKLKSWKMKLSI